MVPQTPDPLLVGLGEALKARRKERDKISQERLYLETGVHRNYIGGIERAERNPTVEVIAKLAAGLEIAPSQLFARAEQNAERLGASWPSGEHSDGSSR